MNAPSMITNKINSTKANAAPERPVLPLHPHVFINIPPFLSLHFYSTQKLKLCECLLLYFFQFSDSINNEGENYEKENFNFM
jgi:hypothetical protein